MEHAILFSSTTHTRTFEHVGVDTDAVDNRSAIPLLGAAAYYYPACGTVTERRHRQRRIGA